MDKDMVLLNYSQADERLKTSYKKEVYCFLYGLHKEYPGFYGWYSGLFAGDDLKKGREIALITVKGELAAVSIWKRSVHEKKVCTLCVRGGFRGRGYGRILMEAGFEYLDTDTPFFTVNSEHVGQFANLFGYYGFSANEEKRGYYRLCGRELVYNGSLPGKNYWINKIKSEVLYSQLPEIICGYRGWFDRCVSGKLWAGSQLI